MERMKFDKQGRLEFVDGTKVDAENKNYSKKRKITGRNLFREEPIILQKNKENVLRRINNPEDSDYWSLYKDGNKLEPLRFSNGKTQEDVVREVVELVRAGKKLIFLHGVCGTGKSAIALNIARCLGKAAVVVPVKNLQKQYEEDYMGKMFVLNSIGVEMKISIITGRNNHDSVYKPGVSCADPDLPDTIELNEKNFQKLKDYYKQNPLIKNNKELEDTRVLRRISIAPANPYWSPIINADYEIKLGDAEKKIYKGMNNKEFIFYHRKRGCSYYDQFQSYIDSDVIIFNAAKYKIEVALDRKPKTEIDIIDEADEFLDSFSNEMELNLTRLDKSLRHIITDNGEVGAILDTIKELISLEEKNKRALGIDEDEVFALPDTNVGKVLKLLLKNRNVESEISMDDSSYANMGIEVAKNYSDFFNDTYLTYRRYENNLYVNMVTTNLSKRLNEITSKNKVFVFMSGTLHSDKVLKGVFGINDYDVVEAETENQGNIEIVRTGKEFDCSYRTFSSGEKNRNDYFDALRTCVFEAKKPMLVHVNSFEDLPSEEILDKMEIDLMSKERLRDLQTRDKNGRLISMFKQGLSDELYSTKCSRGVDFPGDICKSVIFTKYPNPNVNSAFWKILQKTHAGIYWEFYKDKARREFLQRIFRALRFKEDKVFVLSPDLRVLEAVRKFQLSNRNV